MSDESKPEIIEKTHIDSDATIVSKGENAGEKTKKTSTYKQLLIWVAVISFIVWVGVYILDPANELSDLEMMRHFTHEQLDQVIGAAGGIFLLSLVLLFLRWFFGLFKGGTKKNDENNKQTPEGGQAKPNPVIKEPDLLICPKCGGEDLQVIQDVTSRGKDFGAGKACCGYILLGPLGILCGVCGKGKQVSTSTKFICKSCGNTFKNMSALEKKLKPKKWRDRYAELQAAARARHAQANATQPNNGNDANQA